MQLYNLRKKIELFFLITLICITISYGGYRAYPLISGPSITIYNPHDGDRVASTTFELSGQASKVKEITVQGRLIPIGTDGHFTEILVAQKPYTILVITATDSYGKKAVKTLRVVPE